MARATVKRTAAPSPDFAREMELRAHGVWPVAGVDEVGRGPLAGPVAAAAVILDPKRLPEGLKDSKAMSAAAREAAFERILQNALAIGIAFVPASEIDRDNILRATLAAMSRAIAALALPPAFALIDGNRLPELPCPGEAVVKGDAKSVSIAAASIVAKVTRDAAMRHLDAVHPEYGFAQNAGYGVAKHLEALRRLGPTPFHRLSFAPARAAATLAQN
jgi:ribonuclease HII